MLLNIKYVSEKYDFCISVFCHVVQKLGWENKSALDCQISK